MLLFVLVSTTRLFVNINGIKKINNEVLTEEERESKIMKLIDSLEIPKNNYCCKMRIMTYIDLYNIIK